ncbi:MAG TPA: LysE family translocator [Gaiellaceae bacterium]|nr:LysE family translocator [Gaiellaceae bacterium]
MIGGAQLLAFLGVAALVIATPGQDTALTIRNTVTGGRPAGLLTAVGVAGGQAVWTVATSAGLAALIVASQPVFDALRLAGAAYLVWLGLQTLWNVARDAGHASAPAAEHTRDRAFRQGFVSNLGNPKMALFFTSLLPQFAPPSGPAFAWLLGLGLLFCALTLLWLCAYAAVVARAGDALRRPWVRRGVDAVTGTVLVALGARLAAER